MSLPLFPLGTVLAPGARLPLRIFEPRYVAMLRSLLDSRGTPQFGVVAIRAGHEVGEGNVRALHPIGCSAVLEHVEVMPDGSGYAIRARATQRFRLEGLEEDPEVPYLVGTITWLADREGNLTRVEALAQLVRSRLVAYRMLIGAEGDLAEALGVPDRTIAPEVAEPERALGLIRTPAGSRRLGPADARHLSYRVGDLMLLPLADRQALLEAETTELRLDIARRMLRREHRLVSTLRAVPIPLDLDPPSAN